MLPTALLRARRIALSFALVALAGCSSDDDGAGDTTPDASETDTVDDAAAGDTGDDTATEDATETDAVETDGGDDVADAEGDGGSDAADVAVDTGPDLGFDAGEVPTPETGAATTIDPETPSFALGRTGPCGTPTAVDERGLRRWPYLQNIQPWSAHVVWTATAGETATVRYARVDDDQWYTMDAVPQAYPASQTLDEEDYTAWDARLIGLEPGVDYCWELWSDGEPLVVGGALRTAWRDDGGISLIAVGDSGNGSAEQLALRDQMLEVDADVFLHLGDMAYGDGTYVEFERHMFDVYRELMQAMPMWPTPGNHEYKTNIATPYINVYYLPEQAWRDNEHEYYYSFDYGNVHFVSLDSNDTRGLTTLGDSGDDMLDWLEHDLTTNTRPWVVLFMHHPVYSSGQHGNTTWLQNSVLPILEDYDIDLVLVGHDHHYERTHAVLAGMASDDPYAITYVLAGAGGAGLREATGDWFTAEVNDEVHSFLHFEIDGCAGVGRAIDLDGNEIDRFEIDGCE